jgi:hypothetical protein
VDGWAPCDAACRAGGPGSITRPTFRVEKVALFCNPASGGTFSSTTIKIIKWVNFLHLCKQRCPTSWGLGPQKTWNTACQRSQYCTKAKLFQRINALKKRPWPSPCNWVDAEKATGEEDRKSFSFGGCCCKWRRARKTIREAKEVGRSIIYLKLKKPTDSNECGGGVRLAQFAQKVARCKSEKRTWVCMGGWVQIRYGIPLWSDLDKKWLVSNK